MDFVEEIEGSKLITEGSRSRKIIAIFSWITVLLVPTYATVFTTNLHGIMTETSFMWPWMILIHMVPNEAHVSDQFVVSGFPWTFIYFLPFLYIIKLNWNLYNANKNEIKRTAFLTLAALIQIGIIAISFESQEQDPFVNEAKNVYYIPQLIIIEIHLIYSVIWYYKEMRVAMKGSELMKEQGENE